MRLAKALMVMTTVMTTVRGEWGQGELAHCMMASDIRVGVIWGGE